MCVVGGKVVCRGIFLGLFCCQGCLVQSGFVFSMLVPTLTSISHPNSHPNHSHIHPARGPSFLLYWDGQSSDGISQSLPESDKLSSGSPGGDSQGPGQTGAGTWDKLHVPMCRSTGPSCSWATRCLGGQLCFAHPEGCFNCFPQARR